MPLDIPMPWLRGPDAISALSAGASAGGRAAATAQQGEIEGARLAADAMQHNQRNQLEAAKLSQDERIAMMEAKTRKEIAEQNQLRENQRLEIEQAYHQAQLGLARNRLEEQDAIAKQKAKDASEKIMREQNFAAAVSSGMNVMDAYRKFPVSASILNAVTRSNKPAKEQVPKIMNVKGKLIRVDPKTGEATEIYKGEDEGPSILGAAAGEGGAEEKPGMVTRILDKLLGGPTQAPSSPAAAAAPAKRVRVKNPEGKTGFIPESQLDEALAAGYTQVK